MISSSCAHIFEPVGPTIFLEQEFVPIGKQARLAALTLGRIRAVEERNVLIADIAEPASLAISVASAIHVQVKGRCLPMDLALILEQPQADRMHRRIPPPLIKEPPRPI